MVTHQKAWLFFNSIGKLNNVCVPIKARVELSSQMHSLMLSINMRSRIANHFVTVLILAAKLVFVDYKSKNKNKALDCLRLLDLLQ